MKSIAAIVFFFLISSCYAQTATLIMKNLETGEGRVIKENKRIKIKLNPGQ